MPIINIIRNLQFKQMYDIIPKAKREGTYIKFV